MTDAGILPKTPENIRLKDYIDQVLAKDFTMRDFPALIEAIRSSDRLQNHYGAIGIRKILSVDNPPIGEVIDADIVPVLIEFVRKQDEPHLQVN